MQKGNDTTSRDDAFDLRRFTEAQAGVYEQALIEIRTGRKGSHWMWFIFPQIDGLGHSSTSKYYAIKSIAEAQQYLNHPVLGARLTACAQAVLDVEGRTALQIFGSIDELKLRSSMTLFAYVAPPKSVFAAVLDKYFNGAQDDKTLRIIAKLGETTSDKKS